MRIFFLALVSFCTCFPVTDKQLLEQTQIQLRGVRQLNLRLVTEIKSLRDQLARYKRLVGETDLASQSDWSEIEAPDQFEDPETGGGIAI